MAREKFAGLRVRGPAQSQALTDILEERDEQDEMWGDQTHDPAYWLAILGKQVGQLGNAVLKYKWHDNPSPVEMYSEATQAAAVLVAFMEAIEDERLSDEVTSVRPEPRKLARVLDRGHEAIDYDKDERRVEDSEPPPVAPPLATDAEAEQGMYMSPYLKDA